MVISYAHLGKFWFVCSQNSLHKWVQKSLKDLNTPYTEEKIVNTRLGDDRIEYVDQKTKDWKIPQLKTKEFFLKKVYLKDTWIKWPPQDSRCSKINTIKLSNFSANAFASGLFRLNPLRSCINKVQSLYNEGLKSS